jgi:hypothetical protein
VWLDALLAASRPGRPCPPGDGAELCLQVRLADIRATGESAGPNVNPCATATSSTAWQQRPPGRAFTAQAARAGARVPQRPHQPQSRAASVTSLPGLRRLVERN